MPWQGDCFEKGQSDLNVSVGNACSEIQSLQHCVSKDNAGKKKTKNILFVTFVVSNMEQVGSALSY